MLVEIEGNSKVISFDTEEVNFLSEEEVLEKLYGLDEDDEPQGTEYKITVIDSDIPKLCAGDVTTIEELEEIDTWWEILSDRQKDTFRALSDVLYVDFNSNFEAYEAGAFDFLPGIDNEEALGELLVDEGLFGDIADNLYPYIDFEAVASDSDYNITDWGAIRTY